MSRAGKTETGCTSSPAETTWPRSSVTNRIVRSGSREPVGSVGAMGRRAVELLRDTARHAAMREAAIAKAHTFSADRIVPMYEALYEETLRGVSAASRANGG